MIPFSNGSEYRAWRDKNCSVCKKKYDYTNPDGSPYNPECFAEEEIARACVSSGEINEPTYRFIGLDKGWDCPHREPK